MKIENAVPWGCNVCQKRRDSDVNHWWILFLGSPGILLAPYDDALAGRPEAAHACGQDHALVLVTRYMTQGNFDKPPMEATNEPL
jgi:hypothetical protein